MKDMHLAGRMWHLYKMGGITPALTSMFNAQSAQQMAFIRSMLKEQRKNSLYDIPLESMELVVFDLETTGFSPYNGDEIISFGAVSVIGGAVQHDQTYYSIVNPKRNIPDEIVQLTGITNDMAANAPDMLHVMKEFLEFVQKKVMVAHGTGHDKNFLNAALWKTSKGSLSHRVIDTMMIAKWLMPKRKNYGLDALLDEYEIEIDGRHHALQDSLMTAKLWSRFMEEIKSREIDTLGDLYALLSHH
ncbi:DNA polymerase III PolC-type [compost metagenome]